MTVSNISTNVNAAVTTPAASDASAAAWGSAATQQAVATISDTSGKYSLDQQLDAYNSITNLITGSGTAGADRTAVVKALQGSAIYQQVASAQTAYGNASAVPHGTSGTASWQKTIDAFNGLSSSDQQIVVNQINNSSQNGPFGNGQTSFASVDSYKTFLTARRDTTTAYDNAVASGTYKLGTDPSSITDPNLKAIVEAATTSGVGKDNDAWTTKAQAALGALATNSAPAVKVTLSSAAKTALATGSNSTAPQQTPAAQALAALKAGGTADAKGAAALTLLKNVAANTAKAADSNKISNLSDGSKSTESSTTKTKQTPYQAGDVSSTTA